MESAFNNYGFSQRQRDIMKFFNIKYECNDARDDYSRQRKKGMYSSVHEKSVFGQFMDDLDEQHDEMKLLETGLCRTHGKTGCRMG